MAWMLKYAVFIWRLRFSCGCLTCSYISVCSKFSFNKSWVILPSPVPWGHPVQNTTPFPVPTEEHCCALSSYCLLNIHLPLSYKLPLHRFPVLLTDISAPLHSWNAHGGERRGKGSSASGTVPEFLKRMAVIQHWLWRLEGRKMLFPRWQLQGKNQFKGLITEEKWWYRDCSCCQGRQLMAGGREWLLTTARLSGCSCWGELNGKSGLVQAGLLGNRPQVQAAQCTACQ